MVLTAHKATEKDKNVEHLIYRQHKSAARSLKTNLGQRGDCESNAYLLVALRDYQPTGGMSCSEYA